MEVIFPFCVFAIFCLAFSSCQDDATTVSVTQSVSPERACFQEALAADTSLNDCDTMFFNFLRNLQPGTRPAEMFCSTECAERLARTYHCCGESPDDMIFDVPTAFAIQNACAKDGSLYCGDLIRPSLNLTYTNLVNVATQNCNGTNCSSPECATSIRELGCCGEFVLDEHPELSETTLSACEVERCMPLPFILPDLPCSGRPTIFSSSAAPIILSMVLLAVAQFL